ncbi:hypothetical protein [Altericroceibacterium endophyticum]|uniref:Lipoprotein n=1 Tax=Altericroceibacterium endophyticum TaxID=1808508 RepID=A0A6I4T8B6_9SPHN|nr:hypothetical protein [Altericroceibacterium endophyticum]MXO66361.1 hypothetical protein [Altericroceibacterium endophyticum]
MKRIILPALTCTFLLSLSACGGGNADADGGANGEEDTQISAANAAGGGTEPGAEGQLAAIRDFRLTEDFLTRYQAFSDEAAERPCALSPAMPSGSGADEARSIEEAAERFAARPGVQEALDRHGLTAREMLTGMMILVSAAAKDTMSQIPGAEIHSDTDRIVSPENMEFYQKHKDAYQRHVEEVAAQQMAQNGGQIPECMKSQ